MKDKVVVVTGPTSGIGKEIATQLAGMGAKIILACRDEGRGEATRGEISRAAGNDQVSVMQVDTSSQRSIRAFAARFKEAHPKLDVLVNNAGINVRARQLSDDGVELTFATNVLGYHLLTRELLDMLKASAPSRIVNVASTFAGNLDLDDLQFSRRSYVPFKVYQQTKACNRLLTWALGRRLEGTGVTANAMAPGLVRTGLYRDTPRRLRLLLRVIGLFRGRSVQQGADTAVWLASDPDLKETTGKLFELRKEIPCQFRDREVEERLWEICEKMTGAG